MIQASILEQITTFFNLLVTNQNILILAIIIVSGLLLLLIANRFKSKKIMKILYLCLYLGIFGTLFFIYHEEILNLFDYLFDNIFLFLFFPNLAVYILVLVIINIIIIKSTFSEKEIKITKAMNVIFFLIFTTIFYLIVDLVLKNNINVYEQLSIYTNNDLLILVELSMKLFIVWLLILGIIKLSTSLANSFALRKSHNVKLAFNEISNKEEQANLSKVPEFMEIIPAINEETLITSYQDEFVPIKKHHNLIDKLKEKSSMVELKNDKASEFSSNSKKEPRIDVFQNANSLVIANEELKEESSKEVVEETPTENIFIKSFSDADIERYSSIFDNFDVEDGTEKEEIEVLDLKTPLVLENDVESDKNILLSNNEDKITENKTVEEVVKPIITLSSYDSIFIENYEELDNKVSENMDVVFNKENNYIQNIMGDIEALKNNKESEEKIAKIYNDIKTNQKDLSLNDYNKLINALLEVKNA